MIIQSKRSQEKIVSVLPLPLCYAKTIVQEDGSTTFGLDVKTHCVVVGEVAKQLAKFVPEHCRRKLFPSGIALVAACHDIGKLNPIFMKKLYQAVYGEHLEDFPEINSAQIILEESIGYHAGVSQVQFIQDYPDIAYIIGRHHGSNPSTSLLPEDSILGGVPWSELRKNLFIELCEYFQETLPKIDSMYQASAIAGLVTVADWIGSGTVFQNLQCLSLGSIPQLVKNAIKQAGFIHPSIKSGLSFFDIFGFHPRPTQEALIEATKGPGVYILEALMGEGKTEAALYSAYKMMEQGYASGIYFALPTRLTSEKMYERMNEFLLHILESPDAQRLLLLHGTAWLFDTSLGVEGEVGSSWFDSSKRKILAPFAVGTLDQALLSVLHVKHGFVRSFGLAGKVVILDEIHSYDAYTSTILQYLIRELEAFGCTVILLSATLIASRKCELLDSTLPNSPINDPYPQILAKNNTTISSLFPSGPEPTKCTIVKTPETQNAIQQAREIALQGGQVLWIENTVQEAQQIYKHFASWGAESEIPVGLLHSRFPSIKRNELEATWVNIYGKQGTTTRKDCGRILIGTQVLEQSLDIDADFLVTRLAPSDMILQRIGRLWRHRFHDPIRPEGVEKQVTILIPKGIQSNFNPKYGFGPSGKVYDPYVLWRTWQVWMERNSVEIPSDLRMILEETYCDKQEAGLIALAKHELTKNRENLKKFALNGMAVSGQTHSESIATRYSETTTCPVLLIRGNPFSSYSKIQLLDGNVIDFTAKDYISRKKTSLLLMQNIISVPSYIAPNVQPEKQLKWISPFHYIAEDEASRIRVSLLEASGQILSLSGREANIDYQLFYSDELGYEAVKKTL